MLFYPHGRSVGVILTSREEPLGFILHPLEEPLGVFIPPREEALRVILPPLEKPLLSSPTGGATRCYLTLAVGVSLLSYFLGMSL